MKPIDAQKQTPIEPDTPPEVVQHMFEAPPLLRQDQLISPTNEKVYAFQHDQKHLSLRQRFGLMSRAKKILTVVGCVSAIFVILVIALSIALYQPTKKSNSGLTSQTKTAITSSADLNNDDLIDETDNKLAAEDINGDSVVDNDDNAFAEADANGDGVIDDSDSSVSDEDISWWQNLLSTISNNDDSATDVGSISSADESSDDSPSTDADGEGELDVEEDPVQQEEEAVTYTPTPAPVDASKKTTLTATIGSWNVFLHNSSSNTVSGIKSVLKDVDVLGIQEGGTHASTIKNSIACASCDYGMYPSASGTPRKIAIFWHKNKFTLLSSGYRHGSTQDGVKKYFVWVKLKENTSGKVFYVVNSHFPFNSTNGGKLKDTSGGRAYQKHMPVLVGLLKELKRENLPIFITGDFNADYRADKGATPALPRAALSSGLAVKSGWEYTSLKNIGGSAGTASSSRIIDYVFSWKLSNISYQSMEIIRGGNGRSGWSGSDHKPIALKLTISAQNN